MGEEDGNVAEEKRGSTKVPIALDVLEHALGIDEPREVSPDDETPTSPDLLDGLCRKCRSETPRCTRCARCKGTGIEP